MSHRPDPPRLWAVVGATGTGKSQLSIDLALELRARGRNADVVNADAMQLYRGMDIGTAKLPESQRRGIPHHLFDVLDPRDEATVAAYQSDAREVISNVLARGGDAILVGGSGLYVSSVLYEFRFPPRDAELRASLEADLATRGAEALLGRLRDLAPEAAEAVDARNPRRVVRALEVAILGGDPHVVLPSAPTLWYADSTVMHVREDRAPLVERLDDRVTRMWADGLVDEVRSLIPEGIADGPTASRAIGYQQALAQIDGAMSEYDAIAETQRLTRRYARRQVSWFKRYADAETVMSAEVSERRAVPRILGMSGDERT